MPTNPQTPRIILVDRTEIGADRHGSFLKIFALGGETFRIAEKRSKLWDFYRNARYGEPILTLFETYNKIEYIADARPITDELLKRAISHLGEKLANTQTEERNRSTSLSYSKDLVVSGKVDIEDIYSRAENNYRFIKGATDLEVHSVKEDKS